MMTDEQKIAKFNEQAIAYIVEHGTLKVEKEGRTYLLKWILGDQMGLLTVSKGGLRMIIL